MSLYSSAIRAEVNEKPMSTAKLDEKGRIVHPADLIARLKMSPGDEFVIGGATSDLILLKKKDLRTILEGVIKEAQKVDLDKLERDVEEEGNRIARDKYKMRSLALELYREGKLSLGKAAELAGAKSKWEMLMLLSESGVPLDYTANDAEKDLQTLEEVLGR
jgi:AbrB family transcriptional regulator (stage V sporulation protein T)